MQTKQFEWTVQTATLLTSETYTGQLEHLVFFLQEGLDIFSSSLLSCRSVFSTTESSDKL